MAKVEAKYHHLVPKTYMSAWANGSGTLKIEFKNQGGTIHLRNKNSIAGINDFYSIKAGMPLCTASDATTIFAPLSGYTVTCDGVKLKAPLDLNRHYYDFNNWTITRADGTPVSKKQIKSEINQIKIKDIETNWSEKYENRWNQEVARIEKAVFSATRISIPEFDKDYLMKFYTALDWRGFSTNKVFEDIYSSLTKDVLDELNIPIDDRVLPSLETAAEEMRHYVLLHYYREFLSDSGVIYTDAIESIARTSFHFLISGGNCKFITCDSPAFTRTRPDKSLEGVLPITPQVLMVKGKCNNEHQYYVTHASKELVSAYNSAIRENAFSFIIHPY